MSGSESAGAVAGASTVAAGAAVVANNDGGFLSFLGWAAVILGIIVLLSFIAARLYKKWLQNRSK